ncbi:SDR family oxidoreductase [Demequina maris]|uniref:SDR family oxidoreductase n=1 Tax=Demequina maris TaxID=1638982 RepID=UPI000785F033|nr:SDR family oxidoreductase [Demequina maris]
MTRGDIAITGATGNLGGLVARMVHAKGAPERLLARTPSRAPMLDSTPVRHFDYADRTASRTALDGARIAFMVSGPEAPDRVDHHKTFIDAAMDAGVQHIVYTSFVAAAPDAVFTLARDHFETEEHIKATGVRWTFLRDSFYMDFMSALVGDDGAIRGPADNGSCAVVARYDVARAAAAVLVSPDQHAGHAYDMTGPAALTLEDIARELSDATGGRIVYSPETTAEAYASRAHFGAPDWQVAAWVSTYLAFASGDMAHASGDIEKITGSPPMSFREFLSRQTLERH